MRTLYVVPIIHTAEEYGSLGPAISQAFIARYGQATFSRLQEEIQEYWTLVGERIDKAIGDFRDLVIYQDSFPVGEREKVRAFFDLLLADHPRSPNFLLVKKLLDRGAVLEGTEDMDLIVAQLEIYQRAAAAQSPLEQQRILAENAVRTEEITRQRDAFIARRIQGTLPEGGRGILLIGKEHDVISELDKLPEKFRVVYL